MKVLDDYIGARLINDNALAALLRTTDASPSVFLTRPIPDNAGYPIAMSVTRVSDVDEDLINTEVRQITRDVVFYGRADEHDSLVASAAERGRELFHRIPFSVEGWRILECRVRGPMTAPAEAHEMGLVVTLVMRAQRL